MLRAEAVAGSVEVGAAENTAGRVGTEGGAELEVEGADVEVGVPAAGGIVVAAGAAVAAGVATVAPPRSQGFGGEGIEWILKLPEGGLKLGGGVVHDEHNKSA